MIQQGQSVQGALAMSNRPGGVGSSAVTTRIGFDEHVFTGELIAPGMDPIFLATSAAMQKQERITGAFCFVIHFDAVEVNAFSFHGAHYRDGLGKKQSGKST